MAAQVMLFYSLLNWLPSFFRDQGMSATWSGLLLSIMLFVGLPASLVAPVLAARAADQRLVTAVAAGGWIVGLVGLVASPGSLPLLWMVIIGAGQGASVGLALTFPVLRSAHELDAAALGGMAQGLGYAAGATGALAVGLLHSATGGWTVPLLLLVSVAVVQLVAGVSAGRPGHIVTAAGTPAPAPASPR
jgi:CP family cyanate transporter-like MFS transporter